MPRDNRKNFDTLKNRVSVTIDTPHLRTIYNNIRNDSVIPRIKKDIHNIEKDDFLMIRRNVTKKSQFPMVISAANGLGIQIHPQYVGVFESFPEELKIQAILNSVSPIGIAIVPAKVDSVYDVEKESTTGLSGLITVTAYKRIPTGSLVKITLDPSITSRTVPGKVPFIIEPVEEISPTDNFIMHIQEILADSNAWSVAMSTLEMGDLKVMTSIYSCAARFMAFDLFSGCMFLHVLLKQGKISLRETDNEGNKNIEFSEFMEDIQGIALNKNIPPPKQLKKNKEEQITILLLRLFGIIPSNNQLKINKKLKNYYTSISKDIIARTVLHPQNYTQQFGSKENKLTVNPKKTRRLETNPISATLYHQLNNLKGFIIALRTMWTLDADKIIARCVSGTSDNASLPARCDIVL